MPIRIAIIGCEGVNVIVEKPRGDIEVYQKPINERWGL